MDILEFTIELNTNVGIMLCMPVAWWNTEANEIRIIQRDKYRSVSVYVKGDKVVLQQWLMNLGKDGRYFIVTGTFL